MKRIPILLAAGLVALPAAAQSVPPVSQAKVVATYCTYCGFIDFEKGETHKSDCPSLGGSSGGSSSYGGGGDYYSYDERHEDAWNERKAAKAAKKAEREAKKAAKAVQKYARPKKVKLKDYQPMAGKTVVADMGATENTQVIAKYNKKGVPSYGLRNRSTGKWVRKPQFQGITIVGPHAAAASLKGRTAIIDPDTGEPTTEYAFDQFKAFHYPDNARNTLLALAKTTPQGQRTWYMMVADGNGNYTQAMTCSAVDFIEDGTGRKILYRRDDTDKVGMLDEFGNEILPPVFDGLKNLEFSVDNAAYYQARRMLADGSTAVGVIDEKGRMVVPCSYDQIDAKSWGKYGIQVKKGDKTGVYDMRGNQVLPDMFNRLTLEHFWDGNKSWAYYRGTVYEADGSSRCALFNTYGEQLTDWEPYYASEDRIYEMTSRLEEYRIY